VIRGELSRSGGMPGFFLLHPQTRIGSNRDARHAGTAFGALLNAGLGFPITQGLSHLEFVSQRRTVSDQLSVVAIVRQ
jgi:hypothetical protein